ncbi:MAG: hypothetical protein KA524_00040 [Nitrosomonas sp.]|nr:hypothetical protein [Nitrosomonas sp.]MBP6075387.1 hypothetical protein [Nitrosomonas sp.]
MIELLGWMGLAASIVMMIYHQYMHSNYDQVYRFIKKRYGSGADNIEFPSKEDHSQKIKKYSYYTAFCAAGLIIINLYSQYQ